MPKPSALLTFAERGIFDSVLTRVTSYACAIPECETTLAVASGFGDSAAAIGFEPTSADNGSHSSVGHVRWPSKTGAEEVESCPPRGAARAILATRSR